jgi:hypothetical protein
MNNGMYASFALLKERFLRDYPFDELVTDEELKEWLYIAMQKIGAHDAFKIKYADDDDESTIEVSDYVGDLPSNIIYVLMVRDFDTKVPYICTSTPFKTISSINIPLYESAYTYSLTWNHIHTSQESATLEMAYVSIPTDDSGNIMIPDNERYITACLAFWAERCAFRQWLKGAIPDKIHAKLETDWMFHVNSAKTSMLMPDMTGMESFKNMWMSLIPSVNQFDNSFINTNNKQRMLINKR